jgi:hypothetical protein
MRGRRRVIKRESVSAWRVLTEHIGGRVQLKEQGAAGGVTSVDSGMKDHAICLYQSYA